MLGYLCVGASWHTQLKLLTLIALFAWSNKSLTKNKFKISFFCLSNVHISTRSFVTCANSHSLLYFNPLQCTKIQIYTWLYTFIHSYYLYLCTTKSLKLLKHLYFEDNRKNTKFMTKYLKYIYLYVLQQLQRVLIRSICGVQ